MSESKKRQWIAEELTHPKLGLLPANWKWSKIGDEITGLTGGLGTKKSDYTDSGVLLFNKGNVKPHGKTSFDAKIKYVSNQFFAENKKHSVQLGDIVVTLRDLSVKADFLGLVGTYRQSKPALLSQGACVVTPSKNLNATYLAYYSNSPFYRSTAKANKNGTTQVHLRNGQFGAIPIPLPPPAEQRRIVSKIEELFSKLDAGVAALKHAKAQLKRYRQSVLAAAVTGELTKEWRANNPNTEPARKLLKRILTQRREQWNGRGKYKEPPEHEAFDLKEIPETWSWSGFESILTELRNGISKKPDATHGLRILRISAVRPLVVDLEDSRFLPDALSEFAVYELRHNDLLFTRYNGTRAFVGVCGLVPPLNEPLVYPDKLIRARLVDPEALLPAFVEIAMNAGESRRFLEKRIRTTAGQSGISGGDVKVTPLPIPPLAEQKQIVAEVEARTSAIDHIEAELDQQLIRSNRLRQSTLATAFQGTL